MAKGSVAIAWTIAFALCGTARAATDASALQQLLAFAKSNVGLFPAELKAKPSMLTLRVRQGSMQWLTASYDTQQGAFKSALSPEVESVRVRELCVPTGSYVGKTALGASRTVTRQKCEWLDIEDQSRGLALGTLDCSLTDSSMDLASEEERADDCRRFARFNTVIPMSPQQYRDWSARGFLVEIDFVPGQSVKQEVALRETLSFAPTLSLPVESKIERWRVFGAAVAARVFSADGQTKLASFARVERPEMRP